MKIYIDTEYSCFKGQLISMALISSEGYAFYEVRDYSKFTDIHPWVMENVLPILNKEAVSDEVFQDKLWNYLRKCQAKHAEKYATPLEIEVISDWPEDIAHFCQWLCKPEGKRISGRFKFSMCSPDCESAIPHNALEDVKAIREWYMNQNGLAPHGVIPDLIWEF